MKAQIDKQNGVANKDVAQNQHKGKEGESEEGEKTRKKSDKNMNERCYYKLSVVLT